MQGGKTVEDSKKLKITTTKLAAVPLAVVAVTAVLQLGVMFLGEMGFFTRLLSSETAVLLTTSFCQVAAYLFAVLFVRYVMGQDLVRIKFAPREGVNPVPVALAAVGFIIAASRFTAVFNDTFFGFFDSGVEQDIFSKYNIFVIMITTVISPAFFEELVFRGLILTNLLPHGRTFAIVVSGVIFGAIHGSLSQILFATLAGVVLGWVYVETGSLWCGIFIHFMNNLISVCESAIISALPYRTAMKYVYIIEITVLLIGVISALAAVSAIKRRKERATENGIFGITPVTFRGTESNMSIRDGASAFFNPVMIVFLLYSFLPVFL